MFFNVCFDLMFKWRDFVESGGKYDHNEYDWCQPVGRELW